MFLFPVTEETLHRKKAKNGKASRRRLRKYKLCESDNDSGAQQQMLVNGSAAALDSETEDMLPISSICKGDPATKSKRLEAEERAVDENDESNLVTKSEKFGVEKNDDEKHGESNNVEVEDDAESER